jgi:zinc transporter
MSTGLVNAYVLDGHGGARALDWDGVAQWTRADGALWLNLDYSAEDAAAWLERSFADEPLIREALLAHDPRPRTAAFGDNLLLIVRGINQNRGSEPEDMVSVRLWVEPQRVITMRHRASRSLESIAEDVRRGRGPRSPGDLAAELVDRIVEHVATRVDTLGDDIASYEDQLLCGSDADLRAQLADHRRRAIALRRFLAPQRDALTKLAQVPLPVFATYRDRMTEAADRMMRTVEELDAARDRAAVTQEELASRLTDMTNQRLYVLSLITAVFLPLGFVCALLGVNVGGVPYRDAEWAFWVLCGVFIVGVAIQLWVFRRKGWLGRR